MFGGGTLKQAVYDAIFEDIIEGRYAPGSILTESGLMENYAMGKAPVREALIELCKDHALRSLPRKGYLVIPVTLEEIVDLLDFRVDLEIANFRRAVGRFTPEQIVRLQKLSVETDASGTGPVTPHWLKNESFHLELCGCSGNRYTYSILRNTLRHSVLFIGQYFRSAWAASRESDGTYHLAIANAIQEGDYQTAEQMLRKDVLAVKNEILTVNRL